MVIVHVLNDSRFLRRGKWICRHEFAGFYPVDPSKSTWSGEHESVRIDGDDLDTRRGRQRHASRLPHGMQLISLLVRFSHASYTLVVRLPRRARVCGRLQRCLKVRETTAAAQVIVDP